MTSDLAFLFPGQGSQFAGMGREFAERYQVARETFEEADEVLGFSLSRLCFEGPEEDLKKTENTQPALVAASVAALRVMKKVVPGISPALMAGHSLGEFSALVATGSLAFADALRLVKRRGQYMQEAVPAGAGAMAALLKLPAGKLDQIVSEAAQGEVVTAANFNSHDQTVIAGHRGAVERAMELAKLAGARRAVLLPVSAPFHCPLMQPAAERFKRELERTTFHALQIPIVNNWQARVVTLGSEAQLGLYHQIPSPVLWTRSMEAMQVAGIRRFIEMGAGSVLTGLCRNINPALEGVKFDAPQDLDRAALLLGSVPQDRTIKTPLSGNP